MNQKPKPRVLVVDNDPDSLKLLEIRFAEAGAEVIKFSDGATAVQAVLESIKAGSPYDMVVTDIMMPKLSGYEVAKNIRDGGYKGPVIAFTATVSGLGRRQSDQQGITTYLSKETLKKSLLQALINEYCAVKV